MINRYVKVMFISIIFALSSSVSASSIEQLLADEQVLVLAKLENEGPIVAKQPVTISIEWLTQRWFGSGNRIHEFDMPNMVKLPLDGQAINGFTQLNGKKWTSQIREITLFPMEPGIYELPPFTVDAAVMTPDGEVKGTLETKAITLNVTLPNELQILDNYVVTNDFDVEVSGEFLQDKAYKIGEAVTLNYRLTANDVPAMMLPKVPDINIEGVGIYRKKPKLFDKSNRGELIGHREEEINLIFEKQGNYQIPEIRMYWWSSDEQSVKEVVLPSHSWVVSGEVLAAEQDKGTSLWNQIKTLEWQKLLLMLVFGLIVYKLIKLVVTHWSFAVALYRQITHYERRKLAQAYFAAVSQKDYRLACQKLYLLIPFYEQQPLNVEQAFSNKTLINCYGKSEEQLTRVKHLLDLAFGEKQGTFELSEAKAILRQVKPKKQSSGQIVNNGKILLNKGEGP